MGEEVTQMVEKVETAIEVVFSGWIGYGIYLMMGYKEECFSIIPVISYVFLFALIVGLITLLKVTLLLLVYLLYFISHLFGSSLDLTNYFSNHPHPSNQ